MKKSILYPLVSIIVIIIFLIIGKKAGWIGNEFKHKVTTEIAKKRTLTEIITANGKITPELKIKVTSDVSGEILELPVKEGDQVKQGQILAKIQPDIYQRNLEKMEAAVVSSEANLSQALAQFKQKELDYKRKKLLWEQQTISESEYELALADYNVSQSSVDAAKASLKNAKASRNEAKDNLSKTTIYSPMDGTISSLKVEKGERVVGTAQFEGTEMMTIADLNNMEVVVDVNENDIIRVNLNDTAIIEVDAYLKEKFKGIVTQIANSANVEGTSADQITNFEVEILILPESYQQLINELGNNFHPFRPGMSATVDIQTNTKVNVLSVPILSVTSRKDTSIVENSKEDEKIEVVFISENGKAKQQAVTTGIQDLKYIEVLSGITDSSVVISGPYNVISKKIKDGDLIEITDDKKQKRED